MSWFGKSARTIWDNSLPLLGLAFVVIYCLVALRRMAYPFELEWIEGGMLDHVLRILQGKSLYLAPTVEFVPAIYPPLYYYLAALLSLVSGANLLTLRSLSFAASLANFYLLYKSAARESGSARAGIIAAGMFAATYAAGGYWFDVGRVDSLALCLFLLAVFVFRYGRKNASAVLAGVVLSMACFTKQTMLLMCVPLFAYALWLRTRRSVYFVLATAVCLGSSYGIMQVLTHGWFHYYVFALPGHHPMGWQMFGHFWGSDILLHFGIPVVLGLGGTVLLFRRKNKDKAFFYMALFAGALAAACLGRMKYGGFANVLMPAYALGAWVFGSCYPGLQSFIASWSKKRPQTGVVFLNVLCIIAFIGLYYPWQAQWPNTADRAAQREMLAKVNALPGTVWMPTHNYLAGVAGKGSMAHTAMLSDIVCVGQNDGIKRDLYERLAKTIEEQRFDSIVVDAGDNLFMAVLRPVLEEYYELAHVYRYSSSGRSFLTGRRTKPKFVFRKRARVSEQPEEGER